MKLFEGGIKLTRAEVGKNKTKIIKIGGDVYPYKDVLKKYGANWNKFGKFWFFWANKESEESVIEKRIKPAMAEIKNTHEDFIQEIDDIIKAIEDDKGEAEGVDTISAQEESDIKTKLKEFKEMLVNIEDDEDFKNIMKQIIAIKSAQGQKFSLGNSLLIFLQNKSAGIVNSKSNWFKFYNREVKNGTPLMVYAPQGSKFKQSKDSKKNLTDDFYKKIKKKSGDNLSPAEGIKLKELTRDSVFAIKFKLVPVYSEYDTVQTEGTEDFIKKAKDAQKDVKWFEENAISDEVRPVYTGLIDFAEGEGIEVGLVDDLGGARGVSKSGKIDILKNEGNDVGLTKTLAHEIIHELLHQKYLKGKGGKSGKFNIGRDVDTGAIEQQAELSAWMFMHAFGFDVKTTSLNYTVMWGGDKDNMIKVFGTVSSVVNYLIDQVNAKISAINEGTNTKGSHVSPEQIADIVGLGKEFDEIENKEDSEEIQNDSEEVQNDSEENEKNKEELQERIIRKLMKRI